MVDGYNNKTVSMKGAVHIGHFLYVVFNYYINLDREVYWL